jgi:hypothetical protein
LGFVIKSIFFIIWRNFFSFYYKARSKAQFFSRYGFYFLMISQRKVSNEGNLSTRVRVQRSLLTMRCNTTTNDSFFLSSGLADLMQSLLLIVIVFHVKKISKVLTSCWILRLKFTILQNYNIFTV